MHGAGRGRDRRALSSRADAVVVVADGVGERYGVGGMDRRLGWDRARPPGFRVSTGIDALSTAAGLVTGDTARVKAGVTSLTLDGLSMIPFAGTLFALEQTGFDITMAALRGSGSSTERTPSFAEVWLGGLPSWDDIISPFTDPDSWTPRGPSAPAAPPSSDPNGN